MSTKVRSESQVDTVRTFSDPGARKPPLVHTVSSATTKSTTLSFSSSEAEYLEEGMNFNKPKRGAVSRWTKVGHSVSKDYSIIFVVILKISNLSPLSSCFHFLFYNLLLYYNS